MNEATRRINWVSSINGNNEIESLEKSLQDYYTSNTTYFSEIDFTSENWIDESAQGYKKIIELAHQSASICEIGCGKANILKHYPSLHPIYTGLDFSKELLEANATNYPGAKFKIFDFSNIFPVENESYDLVFSVFVLEHVTRPACFLNECSRILKPGGKLAILCPDYLGKGRMTSQRAGFSQGTSLGKLKKLKIIDAIVTLYDNRVKIPRICKNFAKKASINPLFLINCNPVVFTDVFHHDVDAVYLTFKPEIQSYLSKDFKTIENDYLLSEEEAKKRCIFLLMEKMIA